MAPSDLGLLIVVGLWVPVEGGHGCVLVMLWLAMFLVVKGVLPSG